MSNLERVKKFKNTAIDHYKVIIGDFTEEEKQAGKPKDGEPLLVYLPPIDKAKQSDFLQYVEKKRQEKKREVESSGASIVMSGGGMVGEAMPVSEFVSKIDQIIPIREDLLKKAQELEVPYTSLVAALGWKVARDIDIIIRDPNEWKTLTNYVRQKNA